MALSRTDLNALLVLVEQGDNRAAAKLLRDTINGDAFAGAGKQAAAIADPTNLAESQTAIASIIDALEAVGIVASA